MKDKEPKRVEDVGAILYRNSIDGSGVGDANEQLKGNNKAVVENTHNVSGGTKSLPNGYSKVGLLMGLAKDATRLDGQGYQLYIDSAGRIATRYKGLGNSPWQTPLYSGNIDNFMKRPETNELETVDSSDRNNVDNLKTTSGWYKTNHRTRGLPTEIQGGTADNGLEKEARWGTLLVIVENSGHAVNQMWHGYHSSARGRVFYRNYKDTAGGWTPWGELDLHSLQNSFDHHATPHPSLDATAPPKAGYFYTDRTSTNLPEEVKNDNTNPNKLGVIKSLKSGNKKFIQFTPIEGKYKGVTFQYIEGDGTRSAPHWEIMRYSYGHLKVMNDRSVDTNLIKPINYWNQSEGSYDGSGYVMYQWIFGDNLGSVPSGEGHKKANVQTIVPMNKTINPDNPDDPQSQHDWSDLMQIAHFNNGKSYIRHASDKNTWGGWTELTAQGGGGQVQSDLYMKKPELNDNLTSLRYDDIRDKSSGYYRVKENAQEHPASGAKWATALLSWQDNNSHSGSLTVFTVDGQIWHRGIKDNKYNGVWEHINKPQPDFTLWTDF